MKKDSFIGGTVFASISFLIIKFIGAVYVIPFYAIVGELGGALYSYAYTVYSLVINLCTIGIPRAISKIVSEYNTLEMYEARDRTLKIGNKVIIVLSSVLFILMFIFAREAAYLFIGGNDTTGNSIEDIVLVIRSISFCLLIVPYLAIKRGYLQGQKYIAVSSNSEVIEQLVRVFIILVGSYLTIKVFHLKTSIGVAISVFGAFIAGVSAYIYLQTKSKKLKKEKKSDKRDKVTDKTIFKKIVAFSVPVMIISITTDLYNMTDLSLIIRGLSYLGYPGYEAETIASVIATWASKICLIVNAVAFGLSISIIPHMTEHFVKKEYKLINNQLIKSIGVFLIVGLPMSVGICLLANEIYTVFYGASPYGGIVLRILPFSIVLSNVNLLVNMVLQSLNKYKTIYVSSITGLVINASLDIPLIILFSKIGIYPYYGAIVSTFIGTLISINISMRSLKKDFNFDYSELWSMLKRFILPIIAMVIAVLSIVISLNGIFTSRITMLITCLISALVGASIYGFISYKTHLLNDVMGDEFIDSFLKKIKIKK